MNEDVKNAADFWYFCCDGMLTGIYAVFLPIVSLHIFKMEMDFNYL